MKIVTLTALALVLGTAPLLAQTPGTAPERLPAAPFAEIDTDGNGTISPEEWAAHMTARMEARLSQRLGAHADALIQAGDADGDGQLNRDELLAALEAVTAERRAEMGERRGPRHEMRGEGRRAEHRGWQGRQGGDERMRRGETRRGEMQRGERQRGEMRRGEPRQANAIDFSARSFSRIDANNDGAISPEEYASAIEWMENMAEWRSQRPVRGN